MSYYLRYNAGVDAIRCSGGTQELAGSVTMHQVISPGEAAKLPDAVTGGGEFGTEPGSQYAMVRLYGPFEGSIAEVRLDGRKLKGTRMLMINGRPVVNVDVLLSSRKDVVLTWDGFSGPGQTGDGQLRTTPGVAAGASHWTFKSAC